MRTLVALLALLVIAVPATAEVGYGVQINYADDFDFGVGARATFDTSEIIAATRAAVSFDFYFPDDGSGQIDTSYWEFNANGHYFFALDEAPVAIYAGGGLHFYRFSADIDEVTVGGITVGGTSADDDGLGLNILGGVEFPLENSRLVPFAELKFEIGGAEQFVLTGGVTF